MNSDQILGLIRHSLTFGAGLLVARGVASESDANALVGALVGLIGAVWSCVEKRRDRTASPGGGASPTTLVLLLSCLLLAVAGGAGCTRFRTVQLDRTQGTNGTMREIETRASATTFAAGKQALQGWKASQTDKTQGASVGSVNQESDAAQLIEGLATLGRIAAAMYGGPVSSAAASRGSPAKALPDDPSHTQILIPDGYELRRAEPSAAKPASTNSVAR